MIKQHIVNILKRWPASYHLVSNIYWTLNFHHLLELIIGTKARERQWAGRPIAEGYWNNRDSASTHFLVEKIAALSPVHSIFEVGCASGPNLYTLAKGFPEAQITGIDINPEAVRYGNAQFAREGISNVKLIAGGADRLQNFPDRAFDVVFTKALLIYIGPDKIREVIQGILRITHHTLVLIELQRFEPDTRDPLGLGIYSYGNWVRDYAALLRQYVPESQIQVTRIPKDALPGEPWEKLGAVIKVVM